MFLSKWSIFGEKFCLKICYIFTAGNCGKNFPAGKFYQIPDRHLPAGRFELSYTRSYKPPMYIKWFNHIENHWLDVSDDVCYIFRHKCYIYKAKLVDIISKIPDAFS